MRATIKDVAREAGVSVSTVSYALSRKGKVIKDTHKRVLEAAERLGYVPDAKARSLVHNRTNSIGLILPGNSSSYQDDMFNPFYAGVTSIFADELAKQGNWLSLYLFGSDDPGLQNYLTDANVDGFIWYAIPGQVNELVHTIATRRGLPHVGVYSLTAEQENDVAQIARVIVNEQSALAQAAEHLISQGHRRFLCMSSGEWDPRAANFLKALEARGITGTEVIYGHYSEETAHDKMAELLKSGKPLHTAVFAANDFMALGVMRAIREAGLSVPEDISVVGYDDIIISRFVSPPLTTCRHDTRSIAKAAIEYISKCRDERVMGDGMRVEVSSKVIQRDSVAAPKE